jgi:hypothetical protein
MKSPRGQQKKNSERSRIKSKKVGDGERRRQRK